MNNSIEIYRSQDGSVQLNVKLENDTVWLNRQQMAELFGRDYKTVSKHINNALREELEGEPVVAKFATPKNYGRVERMTQDQMVEYFSLEMITSVGYRVKSKQGVAFRKWANSVLKQYLIKGYVINQQLKLDRYNELKDVVRLMGRAIGMQEKVSTDEYSGLFNVISDYVYALDTLDHYDYQSLSIQQTTKNEPFRATYDNAMEAKRPKGKVWRFTMVCQREGRLAQKQHRTDIPDLRWRRTLSFCRGESSHAAISRCKEPFVQRRKQAHCCNALPVVLEQQPCAVCRRRTQTHCRQHPRCPNVDDSREPHRGEGCNGEGCSESH